MIYISWLKEFSVWFDSEDYQDFSKDIKSKYPKVTKQLTTGLKIDTLQGKLKTTIEVNKNG